MAATLSTTERDGVSREAVPLATTWPESGPPILWSVELGEGYAGPAVLKGRVYLLDYDQKERADTLLCLSLADGKEIHLSHCRIHGALDLNRLFSGEDAFNTESIHDIIGETVRTLILSQPIYFNSCTFEGV